MGYVYEVQARTAEEKLSLFLTPNFLYPHPPADPLTLASRLTAGPAVVSLRLAGLELTNTV